VLPNLNSLPWLPVQNTKKYPQLAEIAARVPETAVLTLEEFRAHLEELDKSLRSVPATAQAHCRPCFCP
jgi:hypothetical protein